MNNLHRELAPISDAAWSQIEEEATRTLKRHLAGRRVVDVQGPAGFDFSAVGTGHLVGLDPHVEGVSSQLRAVQPLVELRVPFVLGRQAIDDVDRGARDSDWQAVKDAARQLAFAEDRAIFDGYPVARIEGIRQATSNPIATLPDDARAYPGRRQWPVQRGAERGRLHRRKRDKRLWLSGDRAHPPIGER
jgi:uncharacterized linocin/CFP29 family protein